MIIKAQIILTLAVIFLEARSAYKALAHVIYKFPQGITNSFKFQNLQLGRFYKISLKLATPIFLELIKIKIKFNFRFLFGFRDVWKSVKSNP
jgi:hypothetical protein